MSYLLLFSHFHRINKYRRYKINYGIIVKSIFLLLNNHIICDGHNATERCIRRYRKRGGQSRKGVSRARLRIKRRWRLTPLTHPTDSPQVLVSVRPWNGEQRHRKPAGSVVRFTVVRAGGRAAPSEFRVAPHRLWIAIKHWERHRLNQTLSPKTFSPRSFD